MASGRGLGFLVTLGMEVDFLVEKSLRDRIW